MAAVAINESPSSVLRSLRGSIVSARRAYPDVLHLDVQDARGDLWRFATQDAEWFPSDPSSLLNLSAEDAELDEKSGELRLSLSDGSLFKVVPAPHQADDDPANWKLLTPDGLVLVFGPGRSWQFKRSDESIGLPRRHQKEAASEEPSEVAKRIAERFGSRSDWPDLSVIKERLDEMKSISEVLARQERDQTRSQPILLSLALGVSIVSMTVAVVSLVLSLH